MKRLKIGIRPQLIILVCFSSLLSLLILGIVTGVYFSSSLSSLRAERLEVISQLKATQVKQSMEYIYYQIYWLTTKEAIYAPLSSYRAGNNSRSIFTGSTSSLDQFLASSELFAAAKLYNLDLEVMSESYNNDTLVSNSTMDILFPLDNSNTIPDIISSSGDDLEGYITGPVSNTSDTNSAFFMGVTLPVYANTSIILPNPSIAGYLTVLANAKNLQIAVNDTNSISDDSSDYTVAIIKPTFKANESSSASPDGYEVIFPVKNDNLVPNHVYDLNSAPLIKQALLETDGSSKDVKAYSGKSVAVGFSRIEIDSKLFWSIIVEQPRSEFLTPVKKLRNIIIGVVIGTGVFMCLITFPLAVWFVRPITMLKEATESITKSKKKHINEKGTNENSVPPSYNSMHANSGSSSKRNSVFSDITNTSSLHSTAIRLPMKIQNSKKFFKDELTELSDAFNIMTEELDKQYTHLEDRVKMRTKELEALKIEAESANEAKTVFIANISHELRTPLNGILGMTAIAMDEDDNSRIQESLKLIYRSGELLLHILTELLTYSKNTLNRSKLEKSNFQILEVVYQVQSIFSKLAMDQRVNLSIFLKPDVIRKLVLFGDSNRIIQIVMNLVSNSLKFTPVDGTVDVSFKLLGEYDQESSEKDEFKKVYISKPFRKFTTDSSFNFKKNETSDEREYIGVPEENEEKQASNKSSSFSEKDKTFDTNNDSSSVLTLSTVEYENTIFNAQFNHAKKNGCSSHRRISRVSTKSNSEDNSRTNNQNLVLNDREYKNGNFIENKFSTNEFNESSSVTSSKFDHSKSYSTAISHNFTEQDLHKLDATSLNSDFSEKEIFKDDKTYKIRKLYEPKIWVIQIEVSDTGPGIEPAMQEKVFDPFIQGDQTLSRSYGGTGLGLSICRQLAEMMNGTLTLKSTVGSGSTFTFTVPLPQYGEIMVNKEDMIHFCEDEFNPKSKINRRVAFDIEPENNNISDATEPGSPLNMSNSANDVKLRSFDGNKMKVTEENSGGDDLGSHQLSKTPTHIEIINTVSNTDNLNQNYQTVEAKNNFLHNGVSSGPSTPDPDKKRNLNPESNYFDAPHLFTNSSTGTANSVANAGPEASVNRENGFPNLKILVAEDNMVNQEVIRRMLKLEGFLNITMACNGAEAIELVRDSIKESKGFDLILMDVQMPMVDGLLATTRIRNELQYTKPIIALTAFADETNVKECLSCGMSGFLAKPIKRSNLKKIIVEFTTGSKI